MNVITRPRAAPYYRRLLNLFGSAVIAYWPLWEASGSSAGDQSGHGYNGGYIGVTLGSPGIGDGRTCPSFDGINDVVNLYSAGFAGAFNGAEGTAMFWMKVFSSTFWTDGVGYRPFFLLVDGSNYINIIKSTTNNQINWEYRAGNIYKSVSSTVLGGLTSWIHLAITWSATADQVMGYGNGVRLGSIATGLGVWAGALNLNYCNLGAYGIADPTSEVHGWLAHCLILNRPATPTEIAKASRV